MDNEEYRDKKVEEPDLSGTYTAADYMQWKLDELVELIRGKVIKMSPSPSADHQEISRALLKYMIPHFDRTDCRLFHAPFDVYLVDEGEDLKETKNILEPDLCIICDEQKIQKFGCVGAPDMVVEILSPSTSKKDQKWKFDLYEEYGVREYWMVSPGSRSVIVSVLEERAFRTKRPVTEDDQLISEIFPDLEIDLSEVFKNVSKEDW